MYRCCQPVHLDGSVFIHIEKWGTFCIWDNKKDGDLAAAEDASSRFGLERLLGPQPEAPAGFTVWLLSVPKEGGELRTLAVLPGFMDAFHAVCEVMRREHVRQFQVGASARGPPLTGYSPPTVMHACMVLWEILMAVVAFAFPCRTELAWFKEAEYHFGQGSWLVD